MLKTLNCAELKIYKYKRLPVLNNREAPYIVILDFHQLNMAARSAQCG